MLEDRSIIRSRDLTPSQRTQLYRLVKTGEVTYISRGLYASAIYTSTEHRTFIEVAARIPSGVICLLSALRFHELTTQSPFEVWIAIPYHGRRPKVPELPVRIVRFSGKALTSGVEEHIYDGITVRVYSPPKTVADCFKYRNKIGIDIAIEALRDCWSQRKATADELWRFAEICRVSNVMRPYLQMMF